MKHQVNNRTTVRLRGDTHDVLTRGQKDKEMFDFNFANLQGPDKPLLEALASTDPMTVREYKLYWQLCSEIGIKR